MNATAEVIAAAPAVSARSADRWIFTFTAALFVLIALAGFVPTSIGKVAAVQAGQRPPFPPVLHVHAAAMGAWLLLLLAQPWLVATGRRALHRKLGMLGAALLAVIIGSGVLLVIATWQMVWSPAAAAMMPPVVLADTKLFLSNILLVQGRALLTFSVFIGWALLVRRSDPETHKRFLLLGTAIPLVAASDRFTTLLGLTTMPASPLSQDALLLLSVLPLLAWELARHGRLHPASQIWLAVNLPFALATNLLWGTEWWLTAAPRLMGVTG
jgi:hypothetical protein